MLFLLSACNTSTLSFSEIEQVPEDVQEVIEEEDVKLQMIYNSEESAYIVLHAEGEMEADLHPEENVLNIKFQVDEQKEIDAAQTVYYLIKDPEHDTIKMLINGEETAFDNLTNI